MLDWPQASLVTKKKHYKKDHDNIHERPAMEGTRSGDHQDQTEEEADLFQRSKRRNKTAIWEMDVTMNGMEGTREDPKDTSRKASYKDIAMRVEGKEQS